MPPVESVPGEREEVSGLHSLLATMRRRMAILTIAIVALPVGAIAYSLTAEKQYTATAKLLFRDPGFDQKLFGGQILGPSVDPSREAATNVNLLSLDAVARRAADSIKGRQLTPEEIREKVTVAAEGQSNVVGVYATDSSPTFAAELANTIASQYIVFRREADRKKIREAVALVNRQLARLTEEQGSEDEKRSLRRQVEQLRVLAALQTGNAERVQPAETPRTPSSPKIVRNVILALIIGTGIGGGLALLFDRLDRRLHDLEDAEAVFGRPVLGVIPDSRRLRVADGGGLQLSGPEAESFRTLRANLRYYDIDRDIRSLLITSPAPGDGKSTVARYLAATAAAADARVVLLEADLRRPTLNLLYPNLQTVGLSELLTDQAGLAQTIQSLEVSLIGAATGRRLDVITAGSPPPNPTDLLESDRMKAVLADLGQRYDLVVVDTSPVTIVPDSLPLLEQVSGVLVIIREAKSTSVEARRLRDQLNHLAITPLGLVLNAVAPAESGAYDGYYLYAPTDDNASNGPQNANGSTRRQRRAERKAAS